MVVVQDNTYLGTARFDDFGAKVVFLSRLLEPGFRGAFFGHMQYGVAVVVAVVVVVVVVVCRSGGST